MFNLDWIFQSEALLLLNGLNKDKEVTAPLFKMRRLGLRPLETPCCLAYLQPPSLFTKEVVTSLSYLCRLAAATGGWSLLWNSIQKGNLDIFQSLGPSGIPCYPWDGRRPYSFFLFPNLMYSVAYFAAALCFGCSEKGWIPQGVCRCNSSLLSQ